MVESEKPVLVITGVTGFLGSHILLACLNEKKWHIRGTVRNLADEQLAPLKQALGELFNEVELVQADL